MKNIILNEKQYEIVKDENKCFNPEEVLEKLKSTDYFDDFDYLFGDYAYDKLRLKGFCDEDNKRINKINNIKYMDEYREKYCAYGAKYFLLKKKK